MQNRRHFIGTLSALACSSMFPAYREAEASGTASPDGTTVPPATDITDNSGNVWTLASGLIYQNGVQDPNSSSVVLLLWYQNALYQENTAGNFYERTNGGWTLCLDPRLGPTSADGTTIPPAPYIIDNSGVEWTVTNGLIFKNGVQDPGSYNVSLLLWYGGMMYQSGSGGQFYVWTWAETWVLCTDPRIPLSASAGNFYGINGHYDYNYTPAQVITALQSLGCSTYRINCVNDPAQLGPTVALAQAFRQVGLTLFVVIDLGLHDGNGNLQTWATSEPDTYNAGFATASAVATALQPYGVTMYECGNELTRDSLIVTDSNNAGTNPAGFVNANWPLMRGLMRGLMEGVRSVQPSARCGSNFCVADVTAADMLWDGTQPDGSGGYPQIRWDITTWHNYSAYGDIFNIGSDGAGPRFNLPVYCKARFGKPFMITEWNSFTDDTETGRATYVTTQLGEFYAARKTDAIQSVMYYELTSGDDTWGIVSSSLDPIQPTYGAFQSFASGNPDC
jgi:hypothetical protein